MKPEQKAVQLTEDEKAVLNLLKANSPIDLNELKDQTELSNKKWVINNMWTIAPPVHLLLIQGSWLHYRNFRLTLFETLTPL